MGNANVAPSNSPKDRLLGLETVSGKTPDAKNLPYIITTEEAERFIQQRLDAARYSMIKDGVLDESEPQVKISLFSVAGSDRFFPFIIVLPTSASKGMINKKNNKIDSFFETANEEDHNGKKSVILKEYIYKFLGFYTYKKGIFENPGFRRDTGISKHQQSELIKLATPRMIRDGNNSNAIGLVLDPIKIFISMLTFTSEAADKGARSRIRVDINDVRKKESGRYIYFVNKYYSKGNKKHTSNFADQLNFRLRN